MRLMQAGETPKSGGHYFFVPCHKCRDEIIFAEAPTPEQEAHPRVRGGRFACPSCHTRDTYQAREVLRGQVE